MVLLLCYLMLLLFVLLFLVSSSYIFCWMLLEGGTLAFLSAVCLQNLNQKFMSVSSYFLIQVFSSSLFLVSMCLLYDGLLMGYVGACMFNFSLSIKIGVFPFHNWVVSLVYNMNWVNIGVLSTIQKLMPMMLLSLNLNMYYFVFIGIFTMILSMYNSLGLTSMKMIFSYSILSHSSWQIIMLLNLNYFLNYYILYSLLFMVICLMNSVLCVEDFMGFQNFNFYSVKYFMIYIFNLLSLMGVPPLAGFWFKWVMLELFSLNLIYLFVYIFMMTSLVHLYMYMRLLISSVVLFSGKSKVLTYFFWFKVSGNLMGYLFSVSLIINFYFLFLGFSLM